MALGEVALALKAAERHAALDRRDLMARLNHAHLLARNGRAEEALACARRILVDHPTPAAHHFLASCKAASGDDFGAATDFRAAIKMSADPFGVTQSWLSIAEAKRFTSPADEDLASMEVLLARWPSGQSQPEARAALLYALGKAYDDLKRHEAAFAAYKEGARIVAGLRPPTKEGDGIVDRLISGFTYEALERLPRGGIDSRRPIFVVGLPRSGTTLVEQILVSHSQVVDGAEINLFQAAAMPVGGVDAGAIAAFASANSHGLDAIGRAYLHMLEDRFGPQGRVVDKTLNHSRFLGLISRVLPEARVIWLRRQPGAVAWSAFKTWFAQGMSWSWSLEALGRHMRREDRLYAHWTKVLGGTILTVPYEDLVSDPDPWISRILDHVGLPFEPGVERFHTTGRAVTTASFAQVRRPIYTTSMEAWRPYEAAMEPFFDAYRGG